jgi:hypothetical protein
MLVYNKHLLFNAQSINIKLYIVVFIVAAISMCVVVDDTGGGGFPHVLLEASSAQRLINKSLSDVCQCMLYVYEVCSSLKVAISGGRNMTERGVINTVR